MWELFLFRRRTTLSVGAQAGDEAILVWDWGSPFCSQSLPVGETDYPSSYTRGQSILDSYVQNVESCQNCQNLESFCSGLTSHPNWFVFLIFICCQHAKTKDIAVWWNGFCSVCVVLPVISWKPDSYTFSMFISFHGMHCILHNTQPTVWHDGTYLISRSNRMNLDGINWMLISFNASSSHHFSFIPFPQKSRIAL